MYIVLRFIETSRLDFLNTGSRRLTTYATYDCSTFTIIIIIIIIIIIMPN